MPTPSAIFQAQVPRHLPSQRRHRQHPLLLLRHRRQLLPHHYRLRNHHLHRPPFRVYSHRQFHLHCLPRRCLSRHRHRCQFPNHHLTHRCLSRHHCPFPLRLLPHPCLSHRRQSLSPRSIPPSSNRPHPPPR